MSGFFAMSGYGFYIWGAYGIAVLAIGLEILLLRSQRKAALMEARATATEPAADPLAATE